MSESSFTKDEVDALRFMFDKIDTDKNGRLDYNEMMSYFEICNFDTRFLRAIFRVFDKDHNGVLTFDEFIEYLEAVMKTETDSRCIYKMVFEAVDEEKTGKIAIDQIMDFGDLCGLELSREDAEADIRRVNRASGENTLTFEQVCESYGI